MVTAHEPGHGHAVRHRRPAALQETRGPRVLGEEARVLALLEPPDQARSGFAMAENSKPRQPPEAPPTVPDRPGPSRPGVAGGNRRMVRRASCHRRFGAPIDAAPHLQGFNGPRDLDDRVRPLRIGLALPPFRLLLGLPPERVLTPLFTPARLDRRPRRRRRELRAGAPRRGTMLGPARGSDGNGGLAPGPGGLHPGLGSACDPEEHAPSLSTRRTRRALRPWSFNR